MREVTRADPSPQPSRTRPLVLVTAGADVETVVNGLRSHGWHVQRGFNAPNPIADRQRLICVGPVLTTQDAETDGDPTGQDSAATTVDFSGAFSNLPVYGADGAGTTVKSYALSLYGANGSDSLLDSNGVQINL